MEPLVTSSFRLGIVGGGQLGRMLALKAANWDIRTSCLDSSREAPAHIIADQFKIGNMTSFDDVYAFGKTVDVITIESDHVNAEALEALAKEGKRVFPQPSTLRIIQDKGLQREFCQKQGFPIPEFRLFDSKEELLRFLEGGERLPVIVKTRKAGYDGKGVFLIQKSQDVSGLPEASFVLEKKVDIQKELTVIAARNASGEIVSYPLIEMFMSRTGYLVDYLISPAQTTERIQVEAQKIAHGLVEALDIKGLLAIEMFLDTKGNLLVNECSPRPHNSGHQTIEGAMTSQYEQHLRGILNLPLGSCDAKMPSGMINLLGEAKAKGKVKYEGLTECLRIPGVKLHIYGKENVSPNRKMGHITVLSPSYEELHKTIMYIKEKVKVTA